MLTFEGRMNTRSLESTGGEVLTPDKRQQNFHPFLLGKVPNASKSTISGSSLQAIQLF